MPNIKGPFQPQKVKLALQQAVREAMPELDVKLKSMFQDPVWQWPRTTKRHNGQKVGSPRNTIDTGALRDSQKYREATVRSYVFTWSADYATNVFNGDESPGGNIRPLRNIPVVGVYEFRLAEKVADKFKKLL